MPKPSKADLETRVAQLECTLSQRVYALESIVQACNARFIKDYDCEYVALPLTDEEYRAVEEWASDKACNMAGEGKTISGSIDGPNGCVMDLTIADNYILPQWCGFLIRYHYSREDGSHVEKVWGLKGI